MGHPGARVLRLDRGDAREVIAVGQPQNARELGGGGRRAEGGGTVEEQAHRLSPWAVRSFSYAPVYLSSDSPHKTNMGGHENDVTARG
jgi:hypothetical protein